MSECEKPDKAAIMTTGVLSGAAILTVIATTLLIWNGLPDGKGNVSIELMNHTLIFAQKTLANVGIGAICTPVGVASVYGISRGLGSLVNKARLFCSQHTRDPERPHDALGNQ